MEKNLLQEYVQKRNLALPVYACERTGPLHACRFRCKVYVDGLVYEHPEFYSTVKKAEHAAARTALQSLLPNGAWEDDAPIYKNLLQERAQEQGLLLPTYTTTSYDEGHQPIFVSIVELAGEFFTGTEAKSKKKAEMNAAKIAYMTAREQPQQPPQPPQQPQQQQPQQQQLQQHPLIVYTRRKRKTDGEFGEVEDRHSHNRRGPA